MAFIPTKVLPICLYTVGCDLKDARSEGMRGSVSYVTMMVLNPIIILFYQNCSVVPSERAMAQENAPVYSSRAPASVDAAVPTKGPGVAACVNRGPCALAE